MTNLRINPDLSKNRLYFNFEGTITKKTMETLYTDVRFCMEELTPGFDVISDYSECKLLHLNCSVAIKIRKKSSFQGNTSSLIQVKN